MPRMILREGAYVAENATVLGQVRLAAGVSIWYGAVVRADLAPISIGGNTNIQDVCVLHCDPGLELSIGSHVTVGHGAVVHGSSIGDSCLVGMGAILLAGCRIGEGSIIGAGAVVREGTEIPPRSIVVGVPGRIIGRVDEAGIESNRQRALRYLELARRHAAA